MVDIKHLGHLIALADERHFARAAERVHLSQPAFSRSIQSLEQDVGLRLFDRETGDVKPTPAGVFLIERARRLLFDARCLSRDMDLYRDSGLGSTAFGAGPFPTAAIMHRAIPLLRQRYPGISLRLEASNWELLYELLLREEIEFFVGDMRDLPADPRIEAAALARLPAYLYARTGHPLAGRSCSFRQAWDHGLAATKLPRGMQALLGQLLALPPTEYPVPCFESDDVSLLRSLALNSDTAIAAPEAALSADVTAGLLVQLEVTDLPPVYADTAIVTLANRTPSPMAQRVVACIRELVA